MAEDGKLTFLYVSFPTICLLAFIFCIVFANHILPEHCSIFSSNIESGFACDGFIIDKPQPCAICRDEGIASAASIVAGFGFVCFFAPFLVFFIKDKRSRPIERTKLFD
ncbi:MAG: hypothetical protein M3T96_08860 [Acidobacteriota bacterium]|nr:hypothetical protein [Acidobacteriota bacterium]